MSTTPTLEPEQQQPPPLAAAQQAYTAHTGHGSVGPVIAVLAVIAILGAIAVMIGRLCSGRRIMGHGQYDFEGWVETKFSTCIDGRVDPPPPRMVPPAVNTGGEIPVPVPEETSEERKEEETAQHNPHEGA